MPPALFAIEQAAIPWPRGIVRRDLWGLPGPDGFAELMSSAGIDSPHTEPFVFEDQLSDRNA